MLEKLNDANRICLLLLLLLLVCSAVYAQSLDLLAPAPIRSNNLLGRIASRDLGDSRLTHHYYAFTGTPGDLLITVQSRNLNGDLDVFTRNGLRPLLKLTLYAESATPVTKGIYLRKREELILRIEARSPNDEEGTYQLFFGGSFEPVVGGPDVGETETPSSETATTAGGTKRVSSVGARLPEPEPPVKEVASTPAPTPEATPVATPVETATATEEQPKPAASRTPPRGRRPPPRRTPTPTPVKPKVAEAESAEETAKKGETTEVGEAPAKPKATPGSSTKRGAASTSRTTKPPADTATPEPVPESGPRLVIETSDGTLINRSMSSVRRVTVENGQVVVTGKDGKIDRILLVNVVRMSIAP